MRERKKRRGLVDRLRRGLKPRSIRRSDAALKGRSSTEALKEIRP
jgi:hypothetical protein